MQGLLSHKDLHSDVNLMRREGLIPRMGDSPGEIRIIG